jgi:hypothetical protein
MTQRRMQAEGRKTTKIIKTTIKEREKVARMFGMPISLASPFFSGLPSIARYFFPVDFFIHSYLENPQDRSFMA